MIGEASPGALRRDDSRGTRRPKRAFSWGRTRLGAAATLAGLVLATLPAAAATITDSVGRSIEVPAKVAAVVPAGPPAQVLLHALLPDRLAGLVEPFRPDHAIYVDPKIATLPQIPMLSRSDKAGDVAMVSALKPDLVVDYGNASKRYVAADEKIQKLLNTPAALFGGSLTDAAAVVRTLGAATGAEARAKSLSDAITDVLTRAKPLSELGDDARVTVYLARGADGLNAARSGTSFDEPIRLAGGRNVVEGGNGTFKRLNVDEVTALKPSVVIFADRDALSSPLRKALPKETIVVLDAGEPYKVLSGPPSLNRLAGVAALAAILHPDQFKMDPEDVTRIETKLFPIPAGLALPSPLQVAK